MEIIRQWCEGIIIAILISLIIELLVPEGDNKKYVKVVIGIYIVFVVINPLLKFFKYDFDFSSVINVPVEEVNSKTDSIKEFYVEGIKESIKEDIEELGYITDNIEISFDSNFENIQKIKLKIVSKKIDNTIIEPIVIGDNKQETNNYNDIIELLEKNYFIEKSQIIFY